MRVIGKCCITVLGGGVALLGCTCAESGLRRDGGAPDHLAAPVEHDGSGRAEPCEGGVWLTSVDVPPLSAPHLGYRVWIDGRGDEVWVAQTDQFEDRYYGRLTTAETASGARRSHAEAALPWLEWEGPPEPMAIRELASGHEVLWTLQPSADDRPFAAVVRFGTDASSEAIFGPLGERIYRVHAAAPDQEGFMLVAQTSSAGVPSNWRVLRLVDGRVTSVDLGLEVDTPTTGDQFASLDLASGDDGSLVYGAATVRTAGGQALVALVVRRMEGTLSIEAAELGRSERAYWSAVSVDLVGDQVIIGTRIEEPVQSVRYYWLDRRLAVFASWTVEVDGAPLGAGGGAIVGLVFFEFGLDVGLRVGLAEEPGRVLGGQQALVNGFDLDLGMPGSVWADNRGGVSFGFLRAAVQVLTLCTPP